MNDDDSTKTVYHSNCSSDINIDIHSTNSASESISIPLIRSVDKPSLSLPVTISMSEDFLHATVGFRHINTMKWYLQDLCANSIQLDSTPADAVLDPGDLATMRKKDRKSTPVSRSSQFGEVILVDIVFGPEVAVGDIHYGFYRQI